MDRQDLEEKRAELRAVCGEIGADRAQRLLRDEAYRKTRQLRRLVLEREISAEEGVEYADVESISIVIGDEWWVVSGSGDTALLCGDAGALGSAVVRFERVEESVFRSGDCGSGFGPMPGLDVYGLFRVRNSEWRRRAVAAASECSLHFDASYWAGLEHYIVCGKGGGVSCLARGYSCRRVSESIESIRQRAAFWRELT